MMVTIPFSASAPVPETEALLPERMMEAEAFRVSAEEETEAELSPVPVVLQEVAAAAKSRAQIRMEAIRLTFFIFGSSFEVMALL